MSFCCSLLVLQNVVLECKYLTFSKKEIHSWAALFHLNKLKMKYYYCTDQNDETSFYSFLGKFQSFLSCVTEISTTHKCVFFSFLFSLYLKDFAAAHLSKTDLRFIIASLWKEY